VQGDVCLHLDRRQAVPHDVVHLLGDPQPLVGDAAFDRRASAGVDRGGGAADGEGHGDPGRRRDQGERSGQGGAVDEHVQQQDAQGEQGGGHRGAPGHVPGDRVDGDRHRHQHRTIGIADRQVGGRADGGRGEHGQRPAAAPSQRARARGDEQVATRVQLPVGGHVPARRPGPHQHQDADADGHAYVARATRSHRLMITAPHRSGVGQRAAHVVRRRA
jgi:hypothetical protein